MRSISSSLVALLFGGALAACGGDDPPPPPAACDLAAPTTSCGASQVCEEQAGQPTCVAPLVVRGRVLTSAGAGIAGARVTAVDANDAPLTGTALSAADGAYELRVPAARTATGTPIALPLRLRASAAGFETFPSGLRRSLPIDATAATANAGKLVVQNSATDISLDAVANPAALGSIAGVVVGGAGKRGVLVVAEGPMTATAISDIDGAYVLYNLGPGSYTVRGYAAGVQLAPATVVATAGLRADVNLLPREAPLGSVAGSVNIVNAPGGAQTSVVLVVASTFNPATKRGDVPPGLRAPRNGVPTISGAFTIGDVPDGEYVVLAGFENDNLVRDPDTAIGGTSIQRVTIGDAGRQATLPESFKVTAALAVMRPGAGDVPEPMSAPLTFAWQDDSSEERYELEVIDGKGTQVWKTSVPKQTGGEVTHSYAGPALQPGTFYQFRVTSLRKGDVPISATEDLKGVFLLK